MACILPPQFISKIIILCLVPHQPSPAQPIPHPGRGAQTVSTGRPPAKPAHLRSLGWPTVACCTQGWAAARLAHAQFWPCCCAGRFSTTTPATPLPSPSSLGLASFTSVKILRPFNLPISDLLEFRHFYPLDPPPSSNPFLSPPTPVSLPRSLSIRQVLPPLHTSHHRTLPDAKDLEISLPDCRLDYYNSYASLFDVPNAP